MRGNCQSVVSVYYLILLKLMQKSNKSVLITVGSTEFDQLMQALDHEEIWQLFEDFKYDTLWIQKGRLSVIIKS